MSITPDDAAARLQAAITAARAESVAPIESAAAEAPPRRRRLPRLLKAVLPVVFVTGVVGAGTASLLHQPSKPRQVGVGPVGEMPPLEGGVPALATTTVTRAAPGEPQRTVRVITESSRVQPSEPTLPSPLPAPLPQSEPARIELPRAEPARTEPPAAQQSQAALQPPPMTDPAARAAPPRREPRREQAAAPTPAAPPPAAVQASPAQTVPNQAAGTAPVPPAKPRRPESTRQAAAPPPAQPAESAEPAPRTAQVREETRILGVSVPSGRDIKKTVSDWGDAVLSLVD